jgi:hypothetical protein
VKPQPSACRKKEGRMHVTMLHKNRVANKAHQLQLTSMGATRMLLDAACRACHTSPTASQLSSLLDAGCVKGRGAGQEGGHGRCVRCLVALGYLASCCLATFSWSCRGQTTIQGLHWVYRLLITEMFPR